MNFSEEFNYFGFINGCSYFEYNQLIESNRFCSSGVRMIKIESDLDTLSLPSLPKDFFIFKARSKMDKTGLSHFWLTNDERRSLVRKIVDFYKLSLLYKG